MATYKPTYTVSAIETYLRCEKEYELKYVDGVEAVSEGQEIVTGRSSLVASSLTGTSDQRPATSDRLSPQHWGILVHEVMQFLEFPGLLNRQTVIEQALTNQHLADPKKKLTRELDALITRLVERHDVMELLGNPTTLSKETPFLLDCGSFYLRGKLDRLFQMDGHWMVLDFKTDRIGDSDDLAQREKAYAGQMAAYALAVSRIFGTHQVKTSLLFIDGPYLRTKEWERESLQNVEKTLIGIHESLTIKSPFQYPQNQDICRHCPYFELNYCGIKTHILKTIHI